MTPPRPGDYVWAPCGFHWERCRVLATGDGPPLLRTKSGYVFKQSDVTHPRRPGFGEKVHAFFCRSEVRAAAVDAAVSRHPAGRKKQQ